MNDKITVNFWHFRAQLSEWVDTHHINRHQAEAFSLYAAGYSCVEAGEYLRERVRGGL